MSLRYFYRKGHGWTLLDTRHTVTIDNRHYLMEFRRPKKNELYTVGYYYEDSDSYLYYRDGKPKVNNWKLHVQDHGFSNYKPAHKSARFVTLVPL